MYYKPNTILGLEDHAIKKIYLIFALIELIVQLIRKSLNG